MAFLLGVLIGLVYLFIGVVVGRFAYARWWSAWERDLASNIAGMFWPITVSWYIASNVIMGVCYVGTKVGAKIEQVLP